ncbi:MAG: penicillin-binding protein 1C, partial [Oceanospirillaceae bacterium]
AAKFRRSALLGNPSENCPQLLTQPWNIRITSIADQSFYQYQPQNPSQEGSKGLDLQLQAQGGKGLRYWYLDGKYLGSKAADNALNITIKRTGGFQLSVVDEHGNNDMINFFVQ